jgi:hypothetical protein
MHSANTGAFCIYLWRAANAPGALHIAKNLYVAQELCAALDDEGYLVRAVNLETDVEYQMTGGTLLPVPPRRGRRTRTNPVSSRARIRSDN